VARHFRLPRRDSSRRLSRTMDKFPRNTNDTKASRRFLEAAA
jgi:hypothetical protein